MYEIYAYTCIIYIHMCNVYDEPFTRKLVLKSKTREGKRKPKETVQKNIYI